jgi:beta-galactosidase GanA
MTDASFPTGASYYPPHHNPEDWARDVAAMAAAGMTCIRSAELLASWDYIEKERGQPDWGWLDALFDAAQRHGIRILLGTGSPSPPIWLLDLYPDAQVIDRDGVPFPTGTVWGWACRNHPGYRAEVERYLRLLVARYGGHPALWAWQIDNEPGFPFIPRRGEAALRLYDYNPHTVAAFRAWLRAKYGTLEALNVAWRWDCTHHQYRDWAQVQAPRSMPQEWGVVTAWLDWRTFLYENMAAFVGWQRGLIRAAGAPQPAMTNIFALSGREVEMGLDPWRMAREVDAIGYDLYPGINRRLHAEPEYISMFLDMGRSTARAAGAAFWLPELESGPVNGWALGPDYTTSAADITRYNLEALAHGAKAILYQGYREWPCIPIHWGALADFEGQPTPRYQAAARINRMLGEHAALFLAAAPPPAQVALFDDTRNATVLHGMGAEDLLRRCRRGAYRTFWRAGYPVEFVDAAGLQEGGGRLPACVVLPCALLIDAATGAALRRFVERGGTLLAFAKCAWVDERGWSWARQPGAGLEAVFGARAGEAERVGGEPAALELDPTVALAARLQPAVAGLVFHHRQPLLPLDGTAVLARFADGSAAITRRRLGAGQAILVGTHLDAAALERDAAAALLLALAESAGLARPLECTAPPGVDAHLLESSGGQLFILTNNGPAPARVRVRPAHAALRQASELLHGLPVRIEDGAALVELPAWDGAVVRAGD